MSYSRSRPWPQLKRKTRGSVGRRYGAVNHVAHWSTTGSSTEHGTRQPPNPPMTRQPTIEFDSYPALLTPAEAAEILQLSTKALPNTGLEGIPVRSRGEGRRKHVRYRRSDVFDFRNGRGN